MLIYDFYQSMKNDYSLGVLVQADKVNDFITAYNIKLSYIHQMVKIEFPGNGIEIKKVLDELHVIETNIAEMNVDVEIYFKENIGKLMSDYIGTHQKEIEKFNTENNEAINKISTILSLTENQLIADLEKVARDLKIVGFRPRHPWLGRKSKEPGKTSS